MSTQRNAFKYLRNETPSMPHMLPDENNEITADIEEQLKGAIKAWSVYLKHNQIPEASKFLEEYQDEIRETYSDCKIPNISPHELLRFIKKRQDEKAGGADGWRTVELKKLPLEIIELWCPIYELVEQLNEWPEVVPMCITTLIPKTSSTKYTDMRPITLNTIFFTAWACLRSSHSTSWHESACHDRIYGARKGRSTHDAELPGAMQIQYAQNTKQGMVGLSDDRRKCFDLADAKTVMPIMNAVGLNALITGPMTAFYDKHKRIFRIDGACAEPFPTTALVQGDAWSTRFINILFSVLARRLAKATPNATTQFFVDDSKLRTNEENFSELVEAQRQSKLFNELTGQQTNHDKCVAWGTTRTAREKAKELLENGG